MHEGLGYDPADTKKYLGVFTKENLKMIAVGHGSIINRNVKEIVHKVANAKLKKGTKGGFWAKLFGRA